MAIEYSLHSSGFSRGLESKQSEVNAKREELARGEAGGHSHGLNPDVSLEKLYLIIWYSTYMTWYIYIWILHWFLIFLMFLFEEIQKHLTRQLREEKQEAGTAFFKGRVVSQRTSCHWSSIAMIESWVSEAKNQGHHAVDHYLFSSMLEWIYIGCSLTSVTVGKWISYENLFKRTRKLINVSHFLSCKNCALNRAVLVFPSVQKSCSRSALWCSPPCKNRALACESCCRQWARPKRYITRNTTTMVCT